jgi:exosortase/archaeosortase family protein
MRIAAECTAVTPMIVFTAATLALPSPLVAKLKGLLIGAVALYLVNLLRIGSLYALGVAAPELVEFAHLVVWQAALVVFAVGLWLMWAGGARAPRGA